MTSKLYKNSHSELDNLDSKNGFLVNFLIQEINFEVSQIAQVLAKTDTSDFSVSLTQKSQNECLYSHCYALSFCFEKDSKCEIQ